MKRKMKAQGSIELMIIAPVMIFFIYVLYLNGIRLHTVLTAANTNYSDGIAIVRSQTDTHADLNASNYVLNRNNSAATQTESSLGVSLGITDTTWLTGWGGYLLTNQVDPHNSRWTNLGEMDSLRYTVAYPVSPFISVFLK
ncbi:MAG: hypothetical protein II969_00465 [Anaerolineaceae bacterium]|nr:hypothetical protein [Anaerolineaceae bacterium]